MFAGTSKAKYSLISQIAFMNAEVIKYTHDNQVFWSSPTKAEGDVGYEEWLKKPEYTMRKARLEGGQESEIMSGIDAGARDIEVDMTTQNVYTLLRMILTVVSEIFFYVNTLDPTGPINPSGSKMDPRLKTTVISTKSP